MRDRLFRDGIYTLGFRILGVGAAAALGIVTARALGPGGRGIYALPLVDCGLVTTAYGGLNTATAYFMLRRGAGGKVLLPALQTAGLFVAIGVPAAVLLAYAAGGKWVATAAILGLAPMAVLSILYGYQTGIDRVRANSTAALANTVAVLVFTIFAFYLFGREPTAAVVAWVISSNLVAAVAIVWMLNHARTRSGSPVGLASFFSYTARAGGAQLIALLNYRADVYVVAALAGAATLGMYTLAVAAAETILMATRVMGTVSSPHIGAIESESGAAELVATCVRHNVIIALASCTLLWVLAPLVVRLLYGAAFLPMIPSFRVLLVGVFALSLTSPIATYFSIRLGKPQITLGLTTLSACVCIIVSLATVRHYGMLGAAFGSTLGYSIGQMGAVIGFARVGRVSVFKTLVPQWRDVTAYAEASAALVRRFLHAAPIS